MTDRVCSLPELRHQLEVAHTLAKAHVGFVVTPVLNRDAYRVLAMQQARKLEELARKSEKENGNDE